MKFKQYRGCKCPSPLKQAHNPWEMQRDNIKQGMKNAKFERDNQMSKRSGMPEERRKIQDRYESRMAQENDAWMKAQDSYIMKHDPTFGSEAKRRRKKDSEKMVAANKRSASDKEGKQGRSTGSIIIL